MGRKNRIPRTERTRHCEKPGSCLGKEGDSIARCNDAPVYKDYAYPLSENACLRSISDEKPYMKDLYKERYAGISHKLDQTLADPYIGSSPENVETRFTSFQRELDLIIDSPELSTGDKGRYLYHIEARVLEAYLAAFHHRVTEGIDTPVPRDIIEATHHSLVDILDDFDGLYKNIQSAVALKRTEVEIPVLLLRSRDPEFFTWPTLFREDASRSQPYNHDSYQLFKGLKIPNQVKNTDYRERKGTPSKNYDNGTVLVIHQDVVNLDFRDGETHVTVIEPREIKTSEVDEEPYASYDEAPRFIAWGAGPNRPPEEEFATEYIQKIGGYKRDGLVDALVREARGEKLSIEELNMLNGATHYLMASIREKQLEVL